MAASNRVLPLLAVFFAILLTAAAIAFVWLATYVPVQPAPPPFVNESATEGESALPPAAPPSPQVRRVWQAPVFVADATPACGYDALLARRSGEDTVFVQTQVMPVWLGERLVYQVGRWASEGAMLLALDNGTLPVTRCGGGDAWDRVDNVVAANGLLVAYVEAGVPLGAAALYLWPMRTTLPLVDASERPSDLRFADGEFGIYSWSAAQSTVYLRRSTDGGLTWSAPRRLLSDAVRPRVVDTGRVLLLSAYQPTTGNARFLLHTNDWAPTAGRLLPLAPGQDRLETGGFRNLSHRVWVLAAGGALHVLGNDARSNRTILVSARSCNASDVYPGCDASSVVARCTANPNALASACLRLAVPQLHDYHALSRNDALGFNFLGASDDAQTAVVDAGVLRDGSVVVLYYRVRVSLRQMELRLRTPAADLLVDTFDGVSQAASDGGLAYDLPALRVAKTGVYVAYSRTVPDVPQPEGFVVDTRERSRMTVALVTV